MRPGETQSLLPAVKIFGPRKGVDNEISVVALFCTKEQTVTEGVIMKGEEYGVLHTRVEVLRSPASCYSEPKLCFEVAGGDKCNAVQHFGK